MNNGSISDFIDNIAELMTRCVCPANKACSLTHQQLTGNVEYLTKDITNCSFIYIILKINLY